MPKIEVSNERDPRNEKPTDAEIVRVLAERVMNWELGSVRGKPHWFSGDDPVRAEVEFNPLRGWDDAGMIMEAIRRCGAFVAVHNVDLSNEGAWASEVNVFESGWFTRMEAESGYRAISLAAYEWAEAQKEQR